MFSLKEKKAKCRMNITVKSRQNRIWTLRIPRLCVTENNSSDRKDNCSSFRERESRYQATAKESESSLEGPNFDWQAHVTLLNHLNSSEEKQMTCFIEIFYMKRIWGSSNSSSYYVSRFEYSDWSLVVFPDIGRLLFILLVSFRKFFLWEWNVFRWRFVAHSREKTINVLEKDFLHQIAKKVVCEPQTQKNK